MQNFRFNPSVVIIFFVIHNFFLSYTHKSQSILIWVFCSLFVIVGHNNHNNSSNNSSNSNNNKKYKDSCDDSSTFQAPGIRAPLSRSFSSPAVAYGKFFD